MKQLIIGQGKIGLAVSNKLATMDCKVTGMARQKKSCYQLADAVDFVQQDATEIGIDMLGHYTSICIIVSPSERGESGYRNSYLAIAQQVAQFAKQLSNLARIVFISSTGVYGQADGEWIDETTSTKTPASVTSQIILQAEEVLREAFGDKLVVIRPSGIYGVNRLMRVRIAKEIANGERDGLMAGQAWTNRIMDTDLVTIIVKVLTIEQPKPLYLATDYQPVTSFELTDYLCKKIDSSTLLKINNEIAISGKRIHSNIPLEWLEFADWQAGYEVVLQSNE